MPYIWRALEDVLSLFSNERPSPDTGHIKEEYFLHARSFIANLSVLHWGRVRQNAHGGSNALRPPPLFQEWFGLNINLDSHFVNPKNLLIVLFFVVTASRLWLRGEDIVFLASVLWFRLFSFLQIFTRYIVNKKICRTLYDNRMPVKLHRKHYLF